MRREPARLSGLTAALLLRAVLLALLLTALLQLLIGTRYYATDLVVVLCMAAVVADICARVRRCEQAAAGLLAALSAGALESPPSGVVTGSLRSGYEGLLARLSGDRRVQLQQAGYLQTLLDTVPAALLVVDAGGSLTLVNRAAHAWLPSPARRLADLLGAAASELAHLAPGTHRIVHLASGRALLASAARFSTPDGGSRRLICLQRLAGDLDAVELKAWDDMARVLAHEMMSSLTPIASLSQSLDALLRRGATQEVTAALESITRRSHGLMRFVERYRQVADLPAPRLQPLHLAALLAGVERLVRPAFAAEGITLTVRPVPPEARIDGDPDLLEQALINLLRNAGDAVAGRPRPQVSLACGIEEGRCFVDIGDNGPGLTGRAREQIFVPFFTTKPGGSGVGLPLARRIAAGHGGALTLLPAQAGGTVFRLVLPVSGRPAAPAAAAEAGLAVRT